MKIKSIITFFLFFLLASCIFDSSSGKINDNYEVMAIDIDANRAIYEIDKSNIQFEIIPKYVFAVGHNDNYIIAKQRSKKIDFGIINYYVIDIHRKILKDEQNVYGPLNLKKFDSLRNQLKIQDIKFDMLYPEFP